MEQVILTALGIGGATVIGALIGFAFKNISYRFSNIVLSLAADVRHCRFTRILKAPFQI